MERPHRIGVMQPGRLRLGARLPAMPNTFFEGDDQLDEYFEAIGRVIVAANYLDDSLASLYASMLGSDVGQLVASGQSFDVVLQACRAIQKSTNWHSDAA